MGFGRFIHDRRRERMTTPAIPGPREKDFRAAVIKLAKLLNWRVGGFRPAQNRRGQWATHMDGDVGVPDLILVRGGANDVVTMLALELKVGRRQATPEQLLWVALLDRVPGCTARVVWPKDWPWIEAMLKGERP